MARVAFLTHEWTYTGAPLFLARTATVLRDTGENVLVIGPDDAASTRARLFEGLELRTVRTSRWLYGGGTGALGQIAYLPIRLIVNVALFFELWVLLRRWRADLVVLNSWATRYGALPAWAAGSRVVWHLHEYPAQQGVLTHAFRSYVRWSSSFAVFNSHATESWWCAGAAAPRRWVVYDGVEEGRAEGPPERDIDVVFVGRLSREKGLDLLLDAVARLSRHGRTTRVMLVGPLDPGISASDLSAQLNAVPGSRIEYLGVVDQPREAMRRSKILVLPTRREGFGRVLIEAMAEGTVVVATAVGGVPEVIDDGIDGVLVPPNEPERLADALEELLADDVRRSALARRGLEKVRTKFAASRLRTDLIRIFGSMLERNER